ncbi:putative proteins of PilT N-term/Vapc superfamily [Archaeoglobus sulfaticallidus PM70-1]|uniref:PIN domain-containing protein n=1 Tax=Archaeoglobus sulfaticallidus PM70-1 TaxID=387631 RepID=N0BGZ2_9EURY|nr:PIN domain-containing protein [Archaeoglobus sulfaticallidus]AGK61532.1 putative proteins of PilT N-term/Vapc superfamily [Archaeoglobus sulfaticallidus PM70-1]
MEACLDTNFLIYCVKQKIDFVELLRDNGFNSIIIPESVLHELEKLVSELRGKEKVFAKIALEMAKRFEVVDTKSSGDEALIEVCLKRDCHLFTNDRRLIRKARDLGIKTGYVRGLKKIYFDWF